MNKLSEIIEHVFEWSLWQTRFFTILPVIFGLLGALVLFIVASFDIVNVFTETWAVKVTHTMEVDSALFHEEIVSSIIGAIDLYLIAVVLLLFSFGIYELFISEIDVAKSSQGAKVLDIESLEQLKDKLAKVIIMVLIVSFFQQVLHSDYQTPLDMLYFAGSILFLSGGLYFMHKGGDH